MKITYLIIFFSTISVYSQEIEYELIFKDSCSEKIIESDLYHLEKNGKSYSTFESDEGKIILPEKGLYKLFASEIGEVHQVEINQEINSDTLYIPKIREYLLTHTEPNYIFRKCDKKCEGIETGYYSNGTIRLVGEFKNELVVGELKRFYPNGKIKEVSIYNKRGFLTKKTEFDENGELIK
ncbi:hypothetical protein MKO06_08740 [Gramella sp. GC03-9]|uniref:MORN repeat protein n=1 Tax=Christiangramia oceanisediminis TaxID=2920386 RepID=A0A9X2I2V0_9FLAO|nr:hypothetical protein [Gramella oceanisediminis]MCP9199991.1 hypothetical protein [Gramella oceanisediminis]